MALGCDSTKRATPKLANQRARLALGLALLGCTSTGVGATSMAVLGPGVVNDPANKSLRFDILKYGLEEFCHEMTRRGVALKLSDDQPILGRFFAEGCQSQVLEQEGRQSFVVQFSGKGYGYTNLTGRLGFQTAGLVEYAPDFQLHEGALYIYFRPKKIDATAFQLLLVESPLASTGAAVAGINPEEIGRNIVTNQLKRGFTVVRYNSSGETDFGLGVIPKGNKPFAPFKVENSSKRIIANERTEIHNEQQDFIGGFDVTEDGQAISLTLSLDGAAAADVFLVNGFGGQSMLSQFIAQPGPAALGTSPLLADTAQQGVLFHGSVVVPAGSYYLLLDHTSAVGRARPPAGPAGAAKVDYLIQVGDAP